MTDTPDADTVIYEVQYENEYGIHTSDGEFSRLQAAQFVATLFDPELWGKTTWVKVTRTDKPLDMRSIAEIEANVIS